MTRATRPGEASERPDEGTLALLPTSGVENGEHVCAARLADADAAFVVAIRQSPGGWLDGRSETLPPTRFVATYPHPDCVRTVSDPGDLTGIGIAVSEFLDALPADATPGVCLDSLTTLLQYTGPTRVYRFLQVCVGRVRAADGTFHCHVDPSAHGDDVMTTLEDVFDVVLETSSR
ncbi:DUF7504 family protein [Halobacterium wangiae]|uniref:DUF7504 family protein n=1 Tax=Halobacterium wangiae TaxID=2902623 RepID=UPI001E52A310|nr:hypothetical protein [Halobacterium wangiae]